MRKPPTGEPCAGEPHARFGGRGRREPFPTPIMSKEAKLRFTRAKHVLSNVEGAPSMSGLPRTPRSESFFLSDLCAFAGDIPSFGCGSTVLGLCGEATYLHTSKGYCVLTATLVDPRVTLPASLNRTKMRLAAGSNGTFPLPCTKIPKVGVALALIVVVTVGPIAEMH